MILKKLQERLLLNQTTAQTPKTFGELELFLSQPRTFYLGIDPTAPYLHLGHFAQLMACNWFSKYNHIGIILIGEFTGMIGDPSGRAKERKAIQEAIVVENSKQITDKVKIISKNSQEMMKFSNPFKILKNSWNNITLKEFLSLGKNFQINQMLSRDSVSARLKTGISFTEFSYMIFQANDFCHLMDHHNCSIQLGGSDQFGNILSGIDLARKVKSDVGSLYGITTNILTDESGQKLGKSTFKIDKRGSPIISNNFNDAVYLYHFIYNLPIESLRDYVLKLSNLEPNSTNTALANFIVNVCWNPIRRSSSEDISLVYKALYRPSDISDQRFNDILSMKDQFSSFVFVNKETETNSTKFLSGAFNLSANTVKKSVKLGSVKYFDLKNQTWNIVQERSSMAKNFPKACVISIGTQIPILLSQT
eukprot:NODE_2_length_91304_cov_0.692462.p18 type:complete len:421 gc:universal NODE_2_length_91304_cov_0.692462:36287-35025(-)